MEIQNYKQPGRASAAWLALRRGRALSTDLKYFRLGLLLKPYTGKHIILQVSDEKVRTTVITLETLSREEAWRFFVLFTGHSRGFGNRGRYHTCTVFIHHREEEQDADSGLLV
jgi:hypothetical protein